MKYFVLIPSVILFTSLAGSAIACDRHGGGGYNQLSFSKWSSYNEYDAQSDPNMTELSGADWEPTKAAPSFATKTPKKPSFSAASIRAADVAQARLAIKAKRMKAKAATSTEEVKSQG